MESKNDYNPAKTMNASTLINGRCHCGNISYQFKTFQKPDQIAVRKCACSFCTTQGAVYTSDPQGELTYRIKDRAQVNRYRFGHQTADFFICKICGGYPFVTSEIDGATYAVVNVNTAVEPAIPVDSAETVSFEGEDPGTRLARRRKGWIAKVIEE